MKTQDDLLALALAWLQSAQGWAEKLFLSTDTALQAGVLLVTLLLAKAAAKPIALSLQRFSTETRFFWLASTIRRLDAIIFPLCALLLLWLVSGFFHEAKRAMPLLHVAVSLISVWVVVRFTSSYVGNKSLARWIALLAWGVAALNILGLLDPTMKQLGAIGLTVGKTKITLLLVIKGLLTFAGLMWGANAIGSLSERRIHNMTTLTPSLRVLIIKITRTLLVILAFVMGLNSIGIDLTSLAVLSGAIGVGIGFGLQKVVSNFISGIILLLDRSIKPGDVINIGNTYGWVNTLGARCVSVVTRDGKEHLIPNELLITERVENWSYSNNDVRIRIPLGIAYESDVRKAMALMLDAAAKNPRILKKPEPNVLLASFGDSAIHLELRAWIDDPANGIGNITSEFLLDIWDAFHANDISFPFRQTDIHIRPDSIITVTNDSR